jgi:hypothetical protein
VNFFTFIIFFKMIENENDPLTSSINHQNTNETNDYFIGQICNHATFVISPSDWSQLVNFHLKKAHRFERGKWEEYFIHGMKYSNKYCVFAFKDHYVNKSNLRNRVVSMNLTKNNKNSNFQGHKMFSAYGYCVFEDCKIKFSLKMNSQRVVYVTYTGGNGFVRHNVKEQQSRYFRGQSRDDLREALEKRSPMQEYLSRINQIDTNQFAAGNVDYVGKSTHVYRRIAAELNTKKRKKILKIQNLRQNLIEKYSNNDIEKIKGFIQLIQCVPFSIICFNSQQFKLFDRFLQFDIISSKCCLTIHSFIETRNCFYFNEICLLSFENNKDHLLIPLSCMITGINDWRVEENFFLNQWFNLLHSNRRCNEHESSFVKNIICDASIKMVNEVLKAFSNESYQMYSNRIFKELVNGVDKELLQHSSSPSSDNIIKSKKISIHICSKQVLSKFGRLAVELCCGNHTIFIFYLRCFMIFINSETMGDLKESLYYFFSALYCDECNHVVDESLNYFKTQYKRLVQLKEDSNSQNCFIFIETNQGNINFNRKIS